jgi:hypothetical protein
MMTDALGDPIKIGGRYGYSRNESGFSYVRIGKITKINEKTVTMEVEVSKRSLYSHPFEEEKLDKKSISIRSDMLFPVGSIKTPRSEKIRAILNEIFEEDSNGEEVTSVEISGEWINFTIYDRDREGSFANRLRIVENTVICFDLHEIWEGGDVHSSIEEKVTEFLANEK